MIELTTEQRVYALRWAADYLEQHGEQDTAIESLRYCADMTEKYCIPEIKDEGVAARITKDDEGNTIEGRVISDMVKAYREAPSIETKPNR